jgi:hypothetical protein
LKIPRRNLTRVLLSVLLLGLLIFVVRGLLPNEPGGRGVWLPGQGDGAGSATIDPSGPVVAGSSGTWTVRYVAGLPGVRAGGGVVVHFPLYWEWSEPQMAAPALPGYCTVTCSDRKVRVEAEADRGFHYVRAEIVEGWLSPGDTLRFTYGDTTGGSGDARARADSYAEAVQEFVVKVDGDGDGFHEEIEDQPALAILPAEAALLRVYLKGEAKEGETSTVSVAALDRFGNRATGYQGTVRFSLESGTTGPPVSYAFTPEDEGARAFLVRFDTPGFHTLRVVEEGGTLRAVSSPIRVRPRKAESPYPLLWADLHQHSRLSDGTGEPEDLARYARDVGNLDVFSVTDHDHHGLRTLSPVWERLRKCAADAYEPGRFVTLLGYEWTNWTYGHRNVYYRDTEGALFSFADSATNTPLELWASLPEDRAMTIAHHPGGGPVATDWSIPPPPSFERLVEISSIHGTSECFGCAKGIYDPVPGSSVTDALAREYRLGFLGSGDGHVGHPGETGFPCGGLAGIYAADRTREAVWEALRARRTYATTGERILLDFRLSDHWMGEEITSSALPARLVFRFSARGTAPIDLVELLENGAPVDTLVGGAESLDGTFQVRKNSSRLTYYYVRLSQLDGGMAWSSPIWITP